MAERKGFPGIAETGAKPGDTVICVDPGDLGGGGGRFRKGDHYRVIEFAGKPMVHGNSDFGSTGKMPGWCIPWNGWGARWEKVE